MLTTRSVLFPCAALLVAGLAASASADVIYRRTFGDASASVLTPANIGWIYRVNSPNTDNRDNANLGNGSCAVALNGATGKPQDLPDVLPPTALNPSPSSSLGFVKSHNDYTTPSLYATGEFTVPAAQVSSLSTISFYMGNDNTSETARIALQVGGSNSQWYVSNAFANTVTSNDATFSTNAELESLDFPTANWYALTFANNTTFAVASTPSALPAGNISAIGWLLTNTSGPSIRLDTLQVDVAVPEPASLSLLLLGALPLLRRRR